MATKKMGEPTTRDIFQKNLRLLMKSQGMEYLWQLVRKTGLPEEVCKTMVYKGYSTPKGRVAGYLEKLAEAFGYDDPLSIFDPRFRYNVPESKDEAEFRVHQVINDQPDFFADFEPWEIEKLKTVRGVGGVPTPEYILREAQKIKKQKETRRRFEALLETHHFDLLAQFVDALYDSTDPRRK